ncbi:aldo/keto reductase [Sphingomonas sp. SUN019]|uniref:aldo/keto reductase n=1 Tax=Sphingomonas sp. SUN019 TaxID=2937788 RepID=UPI0021640CE2|nr:aldo/keto reductase [Sphingomonas sp. SUN019]UVO51458.1 aldo/keto reductase [Sphingomonas sp. SUN019]
MTEPTRAGAVRAAMTSMTLNDGRTMPQLGMGTYLIPDSQAASVMRAGIDLGFAMVDTAAIYHNERGVGDGLRGGEIWITTKLWNDRHADAAAALDESLALLGRDSVDLYLIHWPHPSGGEYVAAWKGLIAAHEAGKAKSIGVSNFLPEHIDAIVAATGVTPAVNQIELHPRFQQREQRAYHDAHGIVTQSWSPLGQGEVLGEAVVTTIAARLGATAAQVVIAWHLSHGLSVIPKAADAGHLADNHGALAVELSDADVAAIDALDDAGGRIGPEPGAM